MSEQSLIVKPEMQISAQEKMLTAEQIKANRDIIHKVMESVMQKDIHYGTIPGCGKKPTLLKPGSEILLSTFRISCTPVIADLSRPDEVKYQVKTEAHSMITGAYLGSGIGEAR